MARSVFLCTCFPCEHYQESGTHVGLLGGSSLDLLGLALFLGGLILVGRFLVRRLLLYSRSCIESDGSTCAISWMQTALTSAAALAAGLAAAAGLTSSSSSSEDSSSSLDSSLDDDSTGGGVGSLVFLLFLPEALPPFYRFRNENLYKADQIGRIVQKWRKRETTLAKNDL